MMTVQVVERAWRPTIRQETVGDEVVYFAENPVLLGVVAQGASPEAAERAFEENLQHFLAHLESNGIEPPAPTHTRFKIRVVADGNGQTETSNPRITVDDVPAVTVC